MAEAWCRTEVAGRCEGQSAPSNARSHAELRCCNYRGTRRVLKRTFQLARCSIYRKASKNTIRYRTFQLAWGSIYPKTGKNIIRYKRANFYTLKAKFQEQNLRVRYARKFDKCEFDISMFDSILHCSLELRSACPDRIG